MTATSSVDAGRLLSDLGLTVLERGWLSSNNVVCEGAACGDHTVVDTGYDTHSDQTVALIEASLGGEPVARLVNTHLHSDHCGGNAALFSAWGCESWVPEACADAARQWDEDRLSFRSIDQRCQRFPVAGEIGAGSELRLGRYRWQAVAAPGHDPTALMFFQREARVLISGDALWQDRLAIIFPELVGESGFEPAQGALDTIEALDPILVIPGHGPPFGDVRSALRASRARLRAFVSEPRRHFQYAARALLMFRLMEIRSVDKSDLVEWAVRTPAFENICCRLSGASQDRVAAATAIIERLIRDGLINIRGSTLTLAER